MTTMGNWFTIPGLSDEATHGTREIIRFRQTGLKPSKTEIADELRIPCSPTFFIGLPMEHQ